MKTLVFNKNSWHYYIAHKVAGYNPRADVCPYGHNSDICTYTKYVVGAVLIILVAAAVVASAGYIFWHLIFGIIFSLWYHTWMFTDVGAIAAIVIGTVSVVACMTFGISWLNNYRYNREKKTDGFIKNAYKSWKSKYCIPIKFED